MHFKAGHHTITLDCPRVMGVINVTPDSFSDGGRFPAPQAAIDMAARMVDEGAAIVDVGGESTRPGADTVPVQEELDRVLPVIEGILAHCDTVISIDTSKPEVITAATGAGAHMINDIFALRQDGAMAAAAESSAAVCLMHMQGTPATMQENPRYDDLIGEITKFFEMRMEACDAAGISADRLLIDPGFGFGKNDQHNLALLAGLDQFTDLGPPMLVGLSRKRTLGNLTGRSAGDRVAAGVAAAVFAVVKGAGIVRTHDVAATVDALKVVQSIRQAGTQE